MYKKLFLSVTSLFVALISVAQKPISKNFTVNEDILGTRVFIENKGQYQNPIDKNQTVLFVYDHRDEKIYFTQNGLIYEMHNQSNMTEEEKEAIEHGQPTEAKEPQMFFTSMTWLNSNASKQVSASNKQSHYFTFGGPEYNSSTYKKITYQNVYPHIDIEYNIPKDHTSGIKYNVILHPGANYSDIKILYAGDVKKIKLQQNGDVVIKTNVENITEHAPLSFDENSKAVESSFKLENNVLSFNLPENLIINQDIVIDPWVTAIATLSNNNYAYDVDYDFSGNVFIYGGNGTSTGRYKVAKYNTSGVIQWTFGGTVTSTGWHTGNNWSCNFKVNKGTGKTYVGRNNATPYLIRLDVNGNYDNYVSSTGSPNVQEVWNMEFTCIGDVQIFGGGSTSGAIISSSTGVVSNVTTFSPGITGCCQDVVAVAVDQVGNTFVTYLGHTFLQNKIALIAPSFTNSTWLAPTGYSSLGYLAVKNNYSGANVGAAVAFNALAVNMNYVFYYDGQHIGAYNKSNGSNVGNFTNTSLAAGAQGGIAVDDCNNVYVGGNGSILCYNFNGTNFNALGSIPLNASVTSQYVYDVQINRATQTLYVCGSGFVGSYSAAYSTTCSLANVQNPCNFGQGAVSVVSSSINCGNLQGSATVTPIGGVGPFTYTWLPTGTTSSIITGLAPGNYSVITYDSGANYSFTSNIVFTPSVPLSGNVIATPILNCFGDANGTASVTNISGGSGSSTFLWTNGSNTQNTPSISALTVGNYTVTVADVITSCAFTQTFTIVQPSQVGVMFFATSPTACVGNNLTLTAMGSGGSPGYSFAWLGGPTTDTYVVSSNTAGVFSYSVSGSDSHNCLTSGVTTLTFVPNPVLSVSDVSICPFETGTLSVSGATSYTWDAVNTGSLFTDNPISTQQYTVIGSSLGCSVATTANIILKPVPIPTLSSNSPICNGQNLTFTALGGTGFLWSGPQVFSSQLQAPTVLTANPSNSGAYQVTVTAANSCTNSAIINLTVHPTPTISANGAVVCNNQTFSLTSNSVPGASFYWTGPLGFNSIFPNPSIQNPPVNASGNYTVKATSIQGCTNTAIANVTVTALPSIIPSNNSPLCFGDNLFLNGNNSYGGINYSWVGPNGFNSLLQNPTINSVNLAANGVYTITVVAGPCIKTGNTTVLVHPLPTPTASNNSPICEGVQLNFNVVCPASNSIIGYVWQGPLNFVSNLAQAQINNSLLNHTGIYTVLVTDIFGCKNSSSTTVTILNNPTVTAVGDTVCLYDPALLKSFGANSYQWFYSNGNFSNLSFATITKALSLSPTVYTVIGTAANTCSASATATLFTWALPQPSVSVSPKNEACLNTNFILEAEGTSYYSWTATGNRLYNGKTIQIYANNLTYAGIYTLTGIDTNNCRTNITTTLTVYELPQGSLTKGITEACIPFTSDYLFTPSFGSSSLTSFIWDIDGKTYPSINFTKVFTKAGAYPLKAKMTNINGCSNTMSLMINAWPQPVANFTYSPTRPIENMDEVFFSNTSQSNNITEFNWYFIPNYNEKNGFTSNKEHTNYLFKEAGNYPVALVIKNKNGCADSVLKVITVDEDFNVYVPTAFTPNGDKHNELFMPVTRGLKDYHFYVYDRWDELMFESTDPNTGWNGTHKGKDCKQDVYIWKLVVTSKNDLQKIMTGEINLIR